MRGVADEAVRIDKWLWAARFFKTRSLATDAVAGGRVHVNDTRVKPAKEVQVGDVVEITIGPLRRTVHVTGLAERRGSAQVAATLYRGDARVRRGARALRRREAARPPDRRRPRRAADEARTPPARCAAPRPAQARPAALIAARTWRHTPNQAASGRSAATEQCEQQRHRKRGDDRALGRQAGDLRPVPPPAGNVAFSPQPRQDGATARSGAVARSPRHCGLPCAVLRSGQQPHLARSSAHRRELTSTSVLSVAIVDARCHATPDLVFVRRERGSRPRGGFRHR